MKKRNLYLSLQSLWQFMKFGLVGLSNTILALLLYYGVLYVGGHYMLANTVGWVISVLNAYFWNNKYVFKSNVYWLHGLIRTYISYGASFLLSMIILWILIDKLDVSQNIAPILVLFITTPVNFLMNKYWTFRR